MDLAEKLIKDFQLLSDTHKREVIDFVEFLKNKYQNDLEKLMDEVIYENEEALRELGK